MKWFEGQIPTAISKAKQQKSLFVVYIRNDGNEDSQKMDQTWEEDSVGKACEENRLVVMKFQADSDECRQFSVYYPVICVPCVYMISGENGTLLESVGGYASADELLQKINKALEGQKTVPQAATAPKPAQQSHSAPVASNAGPATKSSPTQSAESSSTPQAAPPSAEAAAPSTSQQKESAHERAARMRQKMEQAHQKKEQQIKEAVKQQELERRKVGQEIQKADQLRSEQQAKQLAEDIRKQRLEDKVAREKVLEQLARDKAEKDARFQSEKEKRERERLQAKQAKEAAQRMEEERNAAAKPDTVTIQFRMPDGSTMTNQFASGAPLQEALDYVTENVGPNLKEFTLSTTYPRRNFGPDDMQNSFVDHGLSPRAAIVVLPGRLIPTSRQSSRVTKTSTSNNGIFSWFLSPFLYIYNFMYYIIFGTPSVTTPSPRLQSSAQGQSSGEDDSPRIERSNRSAGARPKSSYARRRVGASGANGDDTFSRREGNIHRINTLQNDNDENNTWNGNSTQQM